MKSNTHYSLPKIKNKFLFCFRWYIQFKLKSALQPIRIVFQLTCTIIKKNRLINKAAIGSALFRWHFYIARNLISQKLSSKKLSINSFW